MTVPEGLVKCALCGTYARPRETGELTVHFPNLKDQTPCAASWPTKKVK